MQYYPPAVDKKIDIPGDDVIYTKGQAEAVFQKAFDFIKEKIEWLVTSLQEMDVEVSGVIKDPFKPDLEKMHEEIEKLSAYTNDLDALGDALMGIQQQLILGDWLAKRFPDTEVKKIVTPVKFGYNGVPGGGTYHMLTVAPGEQYILKYYYISCSDVSGWEGAIWVQVFDDQGRKIWERGVTEGNTQWQILPIPLVLQPGYILRCEFRDYGEHWAHKVASVELDRVSYVTSIKMDE